MRVVDFSARPKLKETADVATKLRISNASAEEGPKAFDANSLGPIEIIVARTGSAVDVFIAGKPGVTVRRNEVR